MSEQLNESQKIRVQIAADLIKQASTILGWIDDEVQSLGSTDLNPINHVEFDLQNTASYIEYWIENGVDL